MEPIHILILAAGAARRMQGEDKLARPVAGVALLRRTALIALATGLPVSVALPPEPKSPRGREVLLDGLDLCKISVPNAALGMGTSLAAGVHALPQMAAVMVLLADMPALDTHDLCALIKAHNSAPDLIHRACTPTGVPGHPVIFPARLRAALLALQGDQGARAVIARNAPLVRLHVLPQSHATTDLDTPEDWAAFEAAQIR